MANQKPRFVHTCQILLHLQITTSLFRGPRCGYKEENREGGEEEEERRGEEEEGYNFCLWQYGRLNNMKVLKQ